METSELTAEKLNAVLDWVGQTVKSAEGFVVEQSPLVAQEIVAWTMWSSTVSAIAGTVAVSACLCVCLWVVRKIGKSKYCCIDDDNIGWTILGVVSAIACAAMFFAWVCVDVHNAIKAKAAPRIVILEYIAKLK